MPDPTRPDPSTRAEERRDAHVEPGADRESTPDEAQAAEGADALDPEVAEHHEEMTERGARQQGEGRIA